MAEQDLQIVVEAINNASKQLKQIEKDLGGLNDVVNDQNKASQKASSGFGMLTGAIFKGNIAANLAMKAIEGVNTAIQGMTGFIKDSLRVASEYELSLTGLSRISQRFGEDQDIATESAKRLASDGLITVSTAAEGLQKLMQGGLSLDQAIELMNAYKNEAAFGRASTIEYDQAVRNLSESFYTENSMIGNLSGQTENWNVLLDRGAELLGKSKDELTKTERAQAKYLAQKELSLLTEGDSIKYAETYAGKLSTLQNSYRELKSVIGNVFMPATREATGIIGTFITSIFNFVKESEGKLRTLGNQFASSIKGITDDFASFMERNSDIIYSAVNFIIQVFIKLSSILRAVVNVIQITINGFEQLATNLIATGKIIYNALTGNWEGVAKAGEDWLVRTEKVTNSFKGNVKDMFDASSAYNNAYAFDLKEWWGGIESTEKEGLDTLAQLNKDARDTETAEQKKARIKREEEIAKENLSYQRAVEKRVKIFQESFDDLVISHRDTIQSLTDDLKEEQEEYDKSVGELMKDYNEAVEEMEKSHAKKTKGVLEDMEEEREKTKEVTDEISKLYNQEVELLRREGEARIGDLQSQLDRELALGDNANQEKIDALRKMIEFEQNGLQGALDKKEEIYNDEIQKEEDKLQKKLDKLQEQINEEQRLLDEAIVKRKEDYEEDLQNLSESYQKKRDELNKTLNEELAIREKFAEDFERIGDRIAEDDLTRMVRKHQEEMAEMKRDHEEKVAEIKSKGLDEGTGYMDNLASGLESGYPKVKAVTDKVKNDFNSIGNAVDDVKYKIDSFGAMGIGSVAPAFYGGGGGAGGGGGGAFARGGLATVPSLAGEAGPEIILPLNFPKRMAQIMQSMGMGGGGGQAVTQNFYVTVNNKQDVDVLMERAGFAMQQGGF